MITYNKLNYEINKNDVYTQPAKTDENYYCFKLNMVLLRPIFHNFKLFNIKINYDEFTARNLTSRKYKVYYSLNYAFQRYTPKRYENATHLF